MPNPATKSIVGLASTYPAGTRITPHSHVAHQLVHAISGIMRVSMQGKTWFVPPARALWIPAKTRHAIQCVGPVVMRTVYLSPAFPHAQACDGVISVSPLLREVLVRLAEGCDAPQSRALADVLLSELAQAKQDALCLPIPEHPKIARLALAFQAEPADQTCLSEWAKRLGFSDRSLIRLIRAQTGLTFRELRRLTRILVAMERLSAGQSVTQTAFDVGFETPSAFIHAFRNIVGQTPRVHQRTAGR